MILARTPNGVRTPRCVHLFYRARQTYRPAETISITNAASSCRIPNQPVGLEGLVA